MPSGSSLMGRHGLVTRQQQLTGPGPVLAGHGRQADPTLLLLLLAVALACFQAPSRLDLLAVTRAPKLPDSLRRYLDATLLSHPPLFFNPPLPSLSAFRVALPALACS